MPNHIYTIYYYKSFPHQVKNHTINGVRSANIYPEPLYSDTIRRLQLEDILTPRRNRKTNFPTSQSCVFLSLYLCSWSASIMLPTFSITSVKLNVSVSFSCSFPSSSTSYNEDMRLFWKWSMRNRLGNPRSFCLNHFAKTTRRVRHERERVTSSRRAKGKETSSNQ